MFWTFLQSTLLGIALLNNPVIEPSPNAGKAVVEWLTPREHDFGSVRHERPVQYVFKFKNITNEPIIVEAVRTTCGCTAANWTEKPIEPGASGEVRIEYDAYQRGDFSKKIKVFFDKQRKADVLKISGTVE